MKKLAILLSLFLALTVVSCDNKLSMMLPQGPEGPQGVAGKSAFEYWKEYFGQPDATIKDFLDAIKGDKGDKGDTPEFEVSIGDDNTWHINGKSTGVKATGADGKNGLNGKDGVSPKFDVAIGTNGNWIINGIDTGKPSRGADGVTQEIEIRSDGYWYINGVKSVKAEGIDGKDGLDGKTPAISISKDGFWVIDNVTTNVSALAPTVKIGSNGNWFINGSDTGKPSKGEDGKTPTVTIGSNGNWFINGVDTNKPSKGNDGLSGKTPTVTIGSNGNWFIDGLDSGKPSKGKDGNNGKDGETPKFTLSINDKGFWVINGVDTTQPAQGKSAYIIWKDAVISGEMTNKDGSKYTGGSSETDYYRWLQGGDVSTLYLYWRDDATGINKDKTIDDFIKELFDCHCDGLSLSVSYASICFSVNNEGNLLDGDYVLASLNVAGQKGTKLTLKNGSEVVSTLIIEEEDRDATFDIVQTLKSQVFTLDCELPTKKGQLPRTISKTIVIEPIQYVAGIKSSTYNLNENTVKVVVSKPTADISLSVGSVNVDEDAAWVKSADGLTYSKEFTKGASVSYLHIVASNDKGYCSNTSVIIDQLAPVEVTSHEFNVFDNCQLELTVQGGKGMNVRVIWHSDGNERQLTESPSGTYSVLLPRTYNATAYEIIASKEGFGDIKMSGKINKKLSLSAPLVNDSKDYNAAHNGSLNSTHFQFEIKNPTSNSVEVRVSAFANTNKRSKRHTPSWLSDSKGNYILDQDIITIPANSSVKLNMYRDVADDYSDGGFYTRFETTSQCGVGFNLDLYVRNQSDFKYGFSKPDGGNGSGSGSGSGNGGGPVFDPETGKYTINAFVEDGFPETPVQIFLAKDVKGSEVIAYHGFAYKSTNIDGYAELTFQMTKEEFDLALGKAGYIQFNLPNQKTYKKDVVFKFD